jgi:polyisoprenyl-phosphate glycosyltransferase
MFLRGRRRRSMESRLSTVYPWPHPHARRSVFVHVAGTLFAWYDVRNMRLWVACPCFFDTESFLRVRIETRAILREVVPRASVTFLLIDDTAGQDLAIASLNELPDVQVVAPPYNLGHQGALVYALRGLGHSVNDDDFVVTMDSDGEDQPADVGALLEPLLHATDNLHKVSIARRTRRHESLVFKLFYAAFKTAFRLLTGTLVRSGNFVAYRGWLLRQVIYHPHFDHCYSSSFVSLPMQVDFVPLARGRRYGGRSRMGYMGLFSHGLRMLMPFSERIATRGIMASLLVLSISGLCLVLGVGLGWAALWPAALGLFGGALMLGFSILLFATFSQTKARSLRGLHVVPQSQGESQSGRSSSSLPSDEQQRSSAS